jgi:hypothetical protein
MDKKLQQNSFNLRPNNLEILIIQHLRITIPILEVLLLIRKKLYKWNRQTSRTY